MKLSIGVNIFKMTGNAMPCACVQVPLRQTLVTEMVGDSHLCTWDTWGGLRTLKCSLLGG